MPAGREWITRPAYQPTPLVLVAVCAVGFVIGWWVASMGPAL